MRKIQLMAMVTAGYFLAVGCSSKSDTGGDKAEPPKKKPHDTHKPGPHDGTVFDWGGGAYHLEFCVDHDKKEARVYVYGDDEKTPTPIKTDKLSLSIKSPAFQLDLMPAKQKGDPEGLYSCFAGIDDRLGKKQDFEGTVSATVAEKDGKKNYAGDFKEDDEGHGHAHEKK